MATLNTRFSPTLANGHTITHGCATSLPASEPERRDSRNGGPARIRALLCATIFLAGSSPSPMHRTDAATYSLYRSQEPITPIPLPPATDPRKVALGQRLFSDHHLSHDGTLACSSCHDLQTNGADSTHRTAARDGSKIPFATLSVFNAALDFRFNWEGNYRTLEGQVESSLDNPANMGTSVAEVLAKLNAHPEIVSLFKSAYGHPPDRSSLLDAIATFERSLLTPGSRFDEWLEGNADALTPEEKAGYEQFKSLGCVSCHQGVNIGGNLYERHGIFHPLASPLPKLLRVPSLRNVATMAPYFHDGSVVSLDEAVKKMGLAQLDRTLSDQQVTEIVAFLKTLTGKFDGHPLLAATP